MKLDLAKAYDKVNWDFLRLVLLQIGIPDNVLNWIMSCVTTVNFAILINGSLISFFRISRGLRQGCPLSSLLFLLKLSRMVFIEVLSSQKKVLVYHLLFVDDVLLFGLDNIYEWKIMHSLLDVFCNATGMNINIEKSCIYTHNTQHDWKRN